MLKEGIKARADLYARLLSHKILENQFNQALALLLEAVKKGKKVLIFGNGGSAAEAQHFAAELVCQFQKKRKAIGAIALTADSSIFNGSKQ